MLAILATVSYLALAQGNATGSDTVSARTGVDSATSRADSVLVSGGPRVDRARVTVGTATFTADAGRQDMSDSVTAQRRRAVEHSDWYYRRLTIHKLASYATLPLFVGEYVVGDKLYKGEGTSTTRSLHGALAGGIGVLFGVNTLTGVWNLWDSRDESQGRTRRVTHAVLMMVSDAGFLATAAMAPEGVEGGGFENEDSSNRSRHRAVAVGSMGVSLASYLMMYLWK